MRLHKVPMFIALASLLLPWGVEAQEKPDRETEIHKNIRLIEMTIPPDTPGEITSEYQRFLPLFTGVLKENTSDQSDECALTVRIAAGFKEVGSKKAKRALARVTAFRKSSNQEYVGNFILYSYATDGSVNKEETAQFLKKQILEPAECRSKAPER